MKALSSMAETINIFTSKRNPRVIYVLNLVFTERLGLDVSIFSDRNAFESVVGPKLNYSHETFEGVFQIIPEGILFEKRVQSQNIKVELEGKLPILFSNATIGIGHDVFAAIFYLVSRYEEYLPHRKDEHGRFASTESILYKFDAVKIPIVDHYVARLLNLLLEIFPHIELKRSMYGLEVSIDVDRVFAFKAQGIARTLGGLLKDVFYAQRNLSKRISVMIGQSNDPLDIYDEILECCRDERINTVFFFQVGETSRFDINNPVHLPKIVDRINQIAIESKIGLHPSYFTSERNDLFAMELERLRTITSANVLRSRQHYLKFRLPDTYRKLHEIGITDDYSMGYPDINGFRASTSTSFLFYDLDREEQLPLRIHPLVFMDLLSTRTQSDQESCLEEAMNLISVIKQFGGIFSSAWHPEALVGIDVPFSTFPVLKEIVKKGK